MAVFDIAGVFRAFVGAGVEFIVVGAVAATMSGAVVNTQDVDFVHSRTPDNISRILGVLETPGAVFRFPAERRLKPNASHISRPGPVNLATSMGFPDLLGTIGRGLAYDDLLPHSELMMVDHGLAVRVLDLETLISTKEQADRDKDRLTLPLLRQALKLKQPNKPAKAPD